MLSTSCHFLILKSALALALTAALAAPAPIAAQTNIVVLAEDGAWTWFNDPRALFHNGVLYYGYVRRGDGKVALSAFHPQTGARTDLWASSFAQSDDHNNLGLLAKQDGTLLAIYSRHATDPFFAFRHSTGTHPVSSADWAAEQTIAPTGTGLSFANPYQLSEESGRIYTFSRNLYYNATVFTSADNGTTWSAPQSFFRPGADYIQPYVKYASDYARRIDVLYTDGHPRQLPNSLYHLYYESGALRKTDGTFIRSFANLPVVHGAGEIGSIIYQYSDAPSADPHQHIPGGRAWSWEVAYQSNGNPVCVFSVQLDHVTGSNWFDHRIYYYYARWTGTQWEKRFIAHAGRPLYADEEDYAGGICMDPHDPNVVYISSNAENPFNIGSLTDVPLRANARYEIWRGVTADGGLTFSWTPITSNSQSDNLRPYVPRGHNGAPAVIWFRGSYPSFQSFFCQVVGIFSAPPALNLNLYENWIAHHYPGNANPGVIGIGADPDGDRTPNLVEFALGMNPTVPDTTFFSPGQAGLPIGSIENFNGMPYLALTVKRPAGRAGITYGGEVSADLVSWSDAILTGPATSSGDGAELVVFRDTMPVPQNTQRFIRLRITK